jgi:hypothetical protein
MVAAPDHCVSTIHRVIEADAADLAAGAVAGATAEELPPHERMRARSATCLA